MTATERGMLSWIDSATTLLRLLRADAPDWRQRIDALLRREDGWIVDLGNAGRGRPAINNLGISDRRRIGGRKGR